MHCTSRETARVLASLGTLGLALALYANSLAGDFVFDDHSAIQVNPDVRTNTPLSSVFKNDFWGLPLSHAESHKSYRPLTVLSFRLNHHLHGLWAPGFHAVNVAAHAGVCVLFFWACLGLGASLAPSLSASLLFASHPIHTEAVANIVGRSELLAAIFFLLALISYQRAGRRGTTTPSAWILLTVALSAVSLLCKEQGVTVLGLCLVLEAKNYLLKPGEIFPVQSKNRISWTGHLLRSFVVLSAIAALLFIRIYLIGRGTPTFADSDNPAAFSPHWKTRFLTYSYLCALNVWLLLMPSQLCHDWSMGSIPLVESVTDCRNFASLSLLAATLTGCTLLARRVISHKRVKYCGWTELSQAINSQGNKNLNNNNPLVVQKLTLFPTNTKKRPSNLLEWKRLRLHSKSSVLLLVSLSWAVIPFLPASNIFFPVGFVVAERVLYLPSMGFCLLVALGINSFRTKTRKNRAAIAVSFLVLVFSAKTVSRNSEWGTSRGLVTAALKTFPGNAKLHMSMGNQLAQQGDRRCEMFYRNAIRLKPNYASAWTNLGLVLVNTGRPKEAEEAYRTALSFKPDHLNANTNMGHLCRLQGRWEEARRYFTSALDRRPTLPTLHYFVGVASEEIGTERDIEVAVEEYGLAVKYNSQCWEAHYGLGRLLASHTATESTTMTRNERLKKVGSTLT
jgi:hypothetical protein